VAACRASPVPSPRRTACCTVASGNGASGNGASGNGASGNSSSANGAGGNGATSNGAARAPAGPSVAERLRATAVAPPRGSDELDFYMLGGMEDSRSGSMEEEDDLHPHPDGSLHGGRAPSPGAAPAASAAQRAGSGGVGAPRGAASKAEVAAERQRRLRRSVFSYER
jgi:hypothetical protein